MPVVFGIVFTHKLLQTALYRRKSTLIVLCQSSVHRRLFIFWTQVF